MSIYDDDFQDENEELNINDLSQDEQVPYFTEASLTTKDDILQDISFRQKHLLKESETDTNHSSAYYHTVLTLLERFRKAVEKTVLFEQLEPFWSYSYEISSDGIELVLSHFSSVDFDKDGAISCCMVDQDFVLTRVECRMLAIDEYSKMYNIENGTVRQWIRRGKIRTAKKYGSEWRIPELTDFPSRGYKFGQYKWDCDAEFPEEYSYLREYSIASFEQDKVDKNLYHISFSGKNNRKSIVCDTKEREAIELMLIANPFVKYISDSFGTFA